MKSLGPSTGRDPSTTRRISTRFFRAKFVDLHLSRNTKPAPLETVQIRREAITRIYRQIVECPLTIMTLGLAEAWFDAETSLYLNAARISR